MKLKLVIFLLFLIRPAFSAEQRDRLDLIDELPVIGTPYKCDIQSDTSYTQLTEEWKVKLQVTGDEVYALGKIISESDFVLIIIKNIHRDRDNFNESLKLISLRKESYEIIDSLTICEFSSGTVLGKFRYKEIEGNMVSPELINVTEKLRIPILDGNFEEESFDTTYTLNESGFFMIK